MDTTKRRTDCPDCGGRLQSITLFDQGQYGSGQLTYTSGPVEHKTFLGLPITKANPKSIHKLQGVMCSTCGRVLLYAEPVDDADA